MNSGHLPFQLPHGQFWLDKFRALNEKSGEEKGACHGSAHVDKNALLCGKRKQADLRKFNIHYGVPYYHPNLITDPKRRVTLEDLQQIIKDYNLPIDEKKAADTIIHEKKTDEIKEAPIHDEASIAAGEKIKAMGIAAVPLIPPPPDSMYYCKGSQLTPERMTKPLPAISADELIKQISLAGAIRAAFLRKIKSELKLNQVEIDQQMANIDKRFPYLMELINIGVYFCSVAAYQRPDLYPWLSDRSIQYCDSDIVNKIISPVLLDVASKEQQETIPQLTRFNNSYTYEELKRYFQSLEREITHYLENKEIKHNSDQTDLPLTLTLTARGHTFSVGYQMKTRKWIMLDANSSPSYEVESSEIAKHVMGKFLFLTHVVGHYPGLKFSMTYDKTKKEMLLNEVIFNEHEAKQSPFSAELKEAYERIMKPGFIRHVTDEPINLCTEIHTNFSYKADMETLVNRWKKSEEYQCIHDLGKEKPLAQTTIDKKTIDYLKKIKSEVLKPDFLAREGTEIDSMIKSTTDSIMLGEIFREIPNKKLWLDIAQRNTSHIKSILVSSKFYSYFKWHLGDDNYAEEIRKVINLNFNSLCDASINGDLDSIKYLVEELKVNLKSKFDLPDQANSNALHCAAYESKFEVVKYLSDKIDVNEKNEKGNTPLYLSIMPEGDLNSVKWLVSEAKADMHCANNNGKTPFSFAMELINKNDTSRNIGDFLFWHDVQQRLAHISPDQLNEFLENQGKTLANAIPLVITNHNQLIKLLNALPENLLIPFTNYFMGYIVSILQPSHELTMFNLLFNHLEIKKNIREAMQKYEKKKLTVCYAAGEKGDLETVKYYVEVLKINPDHPIDDKDHPGSTALHMAALGGHFEIVKYLCKKANPHIKNKQNHTPLFLSILTPGSLEVVKYLVLEEKADMHVINIYGNTPFKKAIALRKHDKTSKEIADFLF